MLVDGLSLLAEAGSHRAVTSAEDDFGDDRMRAPASRIPEAFLSHKLDLEEVPSPFLSMWPETE